MRKEITYVGLLSLVFAGVTLPLDLWGYATMIGDARPVIKAFLPLVGSTLAVFLGGLILVTLIVDILRGIKKVSYNIEHRENQNRKHTVNFLDSFINNINSIQETDRNIWSNSRVEEGEKMKSRLLISKEYLKNLKLVPPGIKTVNDIDWTPFFVPIIK